MAQVKKTTKNTNTAVGARRRMRLLMIAVFCVMIWAGVTVWDQMDYLNEKSVKLEELEARLAEVSKLNEEARKELARLNDPEYQEEKARKNFQVAREGEIVFDVSSPSP
ncbi:FtsB family cell division protein [Paenibacillus senegalensis]|uniref:FtsB family cell division protein n=1 Tax=Paenibacillus senegalensis TaxID=1465766 RepID=UPI0002889009|nr:septum formation initiator family protein [Paenibacillus senegalensis]